MDLLQRLLKKNREWASRITDEDPQFFHRLELQQSPEYLWIGCSDSRVPANQIIDMAPGEVFVHRNVANLVVHTDLNCLSVIQFAVDLLKVKHILIVGHYGCSGIKTVLENQRVGLADNWLRHASDIAAYHAKRLQRIDDPEMRYHVLCELNVLEQTRNVCTTAIVRDAWKRGQPLTVHGWIYGLRDGRISDLNIHVDDSAVLKTAYQTALRQLDVRINKFLKR